MTQNGTSGRFGVNGGTEGLSPWVTIPLYRINCLLKFFQKTGGLATVHLGVVELEGDGQGCLEPAFAVSAPRHKGIVEDAAILIDEAVQFRTRNCRCAYDHGFIIQDILTGLADGLCQVKIISIKLLQIIADGNIAETQSALNIVRYYVDGHAVIFV